MTGLLRVQTAALLEHPSRHLLRLSLTRRWRRTRECFEMSVRKTLLFGRMGISAFWMAAPSSVNSVPSIMKKRTRQMVERAHFITEDADIMETTLSYFHNR